MPAATWQPLALSPSRTLASLLALVPPVLGRRRGWLLITQIALLPVAFYTGDTFRPAPRRPLSR